MCYHAEFGRSVLKGVGINTGQPPKWGALELRSLGMGGVADPKIHAPPHVLSRQIWLFHDKGCMHRREPPKMESQKLQIFSNPVYFAPTLKGFTMEFGTGAQGEKL